MAESNSDVLSPSRWLWAASKVEKMPGGLTKALGGSKWFDRTLVLPAYTGCLHWFRDDGNTCITTLGIERGFIRLTDIKEVGILSGEASDQKVLVLSVDTFTYPLRFRASPAIAAAWERTIQNGREYAKSQVDNGLWLQGWRDQKTVDVPPDCPFQVDDVLKFHDDRIQSMGFALQMPDRSPSCVPIGPKFRLFLVSGGQLRWFAPKDGSMFGERKGSFDLRAIRSYALDGSKAYVVLKFDRGTILMKTPSGAEWVAFFKEYQSKARELPPDDPILPPQLNGDDNRRFQGLPHVLRRAALPIVAWNSSIAIALILQGTYLFWLLLALANVVILLRVIWMPVHTDDTANNQQNEVIHDQLDTCKSLTIGSDQGCVEDCQGTEVQVRGPTYITDCLKQNSLPAFYELRRVQVMAPTPTGGARQHVSAAGAVLEEECVSMAGPLPQFFVLNVQLPEDEPSMFQKSSASTSVVFYFRVREETQTAANDGESADKALRLLLAYCNGAAGDRSMQDRLKIICHIGNIAESGVPQQFHKFNGKPSMVKKAGTLFKGPGHLEMDVDISGCSLISRQLFHQMRNKISSMELRIAVVIEGRTADELPERVWACAHLHSIELDQQAQGLSSIPSSPQSSVSSPDTLRHRNVSH